MVNSLLVTLGMGRRYQKPSHQTRHTGQALYHWQAYCDISSLTEIMQIILTFILGELLALLWYCSSPRETPQEANRVLSR